MSFGAGFNFNEGLAKVAEQYLRKGSKVYLEGSPVFAKPLGEQH
jgi:single-stranded DNA-binding protein